MLGVRLSDDMDQRLARLSSRTHRSKSHYVKEAIQSYLDAHEEALLAVADYEEKVRNGTLKTIPMEEILKELNFERKDLVC